MPDLILILTLSVSLVLCSVPFLGAQVEADQRMARRIYSGISAQQGEAGHQLKDRIRYGTITLGGYMLNRRYFSRKDASSFRNLILSAGLKPEPLIYFCIGGKFILLGVFAVVGFLLGVTFDQSFKMTLGIAGAFGLAGSKLPETVIGFFASKYRKAIISNISDMLDMMVVCAEAGLTLETLIERVGREMKMSAPQISRELGKLNADLRVSSDRRTALMNFGRVPEIEPFKRLAVTLVQSAKFGTPLSETLRTLSVEMRQEMIATAEEKAGKLPSILTIPMILFILPSIFCLLIGPAVLQFMHHSS